MSISAARTSTPHRSSGPGNDAGLVGSDTPQCWPILGVLGMFLTIAFAFALRVWRLGAANVWWDEGYSVYLARKDVLSAAWETAGDVHPPLHYWLLHYWLRLTGDSEFAIRYSSAIFGVLTVPLVYWLGRKLFGRWVGLLAALLLATSRFGIEWSQQIRMYAFSGFLALLLIAITIQLLERQSRRLWLAYIVVTVLSIYTLYLSALVPLVASIAVALLVVLPVGGKRLPRGFLARWVAANSACLVLYLPWIATYFLQKQHLPLTLDIPDRTPLWLFIQATFTNFPLGVSAYLGRYLAPTLGTLALFAGAAFTLATAARRRAGLLLYLLVLIPPFIVYGLTFPNPLYYSPNLSVRYQFIFLPAYLLLVAAAVVGIIRPAVLRPRPATAALVARLGAGVLALSLLAGIVAWSVPEYYSVRRYGDEYTTVVRYLRAYSRPGDIVVLNSDIGWPVYQYYYPGPLPSLGLSTSHPMTGDEIAKVFSALLAEHRGIWLLTSGDWPESDPTGQIPAWLEKRSRVVGGVGGGYRKLTLYSTDPTRSVEFPTSLSPKRTTNLQSVGGASIVGYDPPVSELNAGETLRFAVYWRGERQLAPDAGVVLQLADDRGVVVRERRVALRDGFHPETWGAGQVVRADYELPTPKLLSSGGYRLIVSPSVAMSTAGGAGTPQALLTIPVSVSGGTPLAPAMESSQHETDFLLGGGIALRGFDLGLPSGPHNATEIPARDALVPGDRIVLRLHWLDLKPTGTAYTVFVQLVGPENNPASGNPVWGQLDSQPRGGKSPTSDWVPGESVIDEYEITVPPNAPPGEYFLQAGMYDVNTGQRLPVTSADTPAGDSIVVLRTQLTR